METITRTNEEDLNKAFFEQTSLRAMIKSMSEKERIALEERNASLEAQKIAEQSKRQAWEEVAWLRADLSTALNMPNTCSNPPLVMIPSKGSSEDTHCREVSLKLYIFKFKDHNIVWIRCLPKCIFTRFIVN
ncbi:unnamed protein product [Protopolystoma xenopodis]|uniref:Uncharacterized protein n=1 Tax=Protopolystoma xenopodis TaxID=117903 RepID=A0A3S5A812_9PLAT|nr:unnamed protein product [Protopolystoma xenopodis]